MAELNLERLAMRIRRARTAAGHRTKYVLGRGGFDPHASRPGRLNPETGQLECDCTGFGAWWLQISRHQADKGKPWSAVIPWIETTAIYADATGRELLFMRIPVPLPGCCAVYPDTYTERLVKRVVNGISRLVRRKAKLGEGHFMAITACAVREGVVTTLAGYDCSPSNWRGKGDAIAFRDLSWALKRRNLVYCVLREDYR